MNNPTFNAFQADMRRAYLFGAPGMAVSGVVWIVAAAVVLTVGLAAGIWTLLFGGMAIFPLSVLLCRAAGRSGKHDRHNPLGTLAAEGTFWMLAGIVVALGLSAARPEWFFAAMLLVIGGRYLTFQTLYGLRSFWFVGALLCLMGAAFALLRVHPAVAAAAGGLVELVGAAGLLSTARAQPGDGAAG